MIWDGGRCTGCHSKNSPCVAPTMSLTHSPAFVGWVFLKASGPIKVAVLVYEVLHDRAPSYLGPFTYIADLPSRRGLCSSCSDCLVQPPVHRSTVGSRAFSVAAPQASNCLPPEVTSAPSITTFRTRLKTFCSLTFGLSDILCLHNVYSEFSSASNT